ncbi:MAG TPA: hypothetical protein ENO10_00465 [Salinimicrobium catena]|uniref:Uncharacterized protein n=1 Tax=Salinimicrobium catena TaxID=390640 RepID=A0A7C2RNT6_9FLAO|nr:hypothetical protein [Salinimicrobium catena]
MTEEKKWKRHPKFRDLRISSDGSDFLLNDKLLKIRDHKIKNGKILKVVMINRTYYSVPKLILETWGAPKPEDGRLYFAIYKDGNKENLHPKNLFWGTRLMNREDLFERDLKLSRLTKDQTYEAFHRSQFHGESIASIARDMKVSDMAIHRAIKRLRRKVEAE